MPLNELKLFEVMLERRVHELRLKTDVHRISCAMVTYGGGFVKSLGRAFLAADDDNKRRLLEAFPEFVMDYDAIAHERDVKG